MDRIIEIKVNGSHLTKDSRIAGVQHEGNAKTLRIEFDPGWDGYAKKVTFWDATGENPVERTLTADLLEDITESTRIYLCKIPPEPMAEAGEFTFVIDGYTDGVRQRSVADTLVVKAAPFIEQADEPTDPTPSQAEQLQVQIDTLLGDIQKEAIRAEDAADRAEDAQDGAEAAQKAAETAADEAGKAQAAIENMTASSETLAPGSEASVTKTTKDGVVNLHFGIPKGAKGDPGEGGGGGSGDMSADTYDPTGKAQDIFAYADKAAAGALSGAKTYTDQKIADIPATDVSGQINAHNADPTAHADIRDDLAQKADSDHKHTAADVGALALDGSNSMSGNLQIQNASPVFAMTSETTGRFHKVLGGSAGATYIYTQADANNYNVLKLNPETSDLSEAMQLVRVVGGTMKRYNVLHAGNLAEMGVGAQMAYGSYEGTGTYGEAAPNTLTFPFAPDVFIMLADTTVDGSVKTVRPALGGLFGGLTETAKARTAVLPMEFVPVDAYPAEGSNTNPTNMFGVDDGEYAPAKKSADGKTLDWYHTTSAAAQFNSSGYTYYWMAIKF